MKRILFALGMVGTACAALAWAPHYLDAVTTDGEAELRCGTDFSGPLAGVYVEARDATVWGGACHISSEAVSAGRRAALGWSFTGGSHAGIGLAGTQVVAVLEGSSNLQGPEVFGGDEEPTISSHVWIDAPSAQVREAALAFIAEVADLGSVLEVNQAKVTVEFEDDLFVMDVENSLSVRGEAMPDRSCCTMPESRWYSPLAKVEGSVVGNPSECRFEGVGSSLGRWAFEGANSVFVADLGPMR